MAVDADARNYNESVSATLNASGNGAVFNPSLGVPVRLLLTGTWVGSVAVQRSDDGGTTWSGLTIVAGPWAVFTANCNEEIEESYHDQVRYRVVFTRTSGSVTYRLGH